MGNCLVTKLKGVIDNDNLSILGTLKIDFVVNGQESSYIHITTPGQMSHFSISDPSKCFYYEGNRTVNSIDGYTCYEQLKDPGEYSVLCDHLYDVETIDLGQHVLKNPIDLSSLKYTKLKVLAVFGISGRLRGDIIDLKDKDISTLNIPEQIDVTGNIKYLGSMTNLSLLAISGTSIFGNIEEFVQIQVQSGRESYEFKDDDMRYLGACLGLRFNSQPIANQAQNFLSWETNASDNSKIDITLNGTTITVNKL